MAEESLSQADKFQPFRECRHRDPLLAQSIDLENALKDLRDERILARARSFPRTWIFHAAMSAILLLSSAGFSLSQSLAPAAWAPLLGAAAYFAAAIGSSSKHANAKAKLLKSLSARAAKRAGCPSFTRSHPASGASDLDY